MSKPDNIYRIATNGIEYAVQKLCPKKQASEPDTWEFVIDSRTNAVEYRYHRFDAEVVLQYIKAAEARETRQWVSADNLPKLEYKGESNDN